MESGGKDRPPLSGDAVHERVAERGRRGLHSREVRLQRRRELLPEDPGLGLMLGLGLGLELRLRLGFVVWGSVGVRGCG